jgi:hypothetical protein
MAAASPGPLLDETETTTSLLDPWFFGGKTCIYIFAHETVGR